MNAVVTVKSIKVFGDSTEYPAEEVTMKKFVKWAMETKADLRAHPMLNEQLRVLDQCITTEAMTVLWACTALQQAGVPRAYPSEAVKSAVTQANLRARCDFHITWLTDIVAACATSQTHAQPYEVRLGAQRRRDRRVSPVQVHHGRARNRVPERP